MSGNNQPGGNRPQGGQQPQGNQRPQGGRQQGRQAGRPPQGGGGIDTGTIRDIALFGVLMLAIAGIAFGLSPFLAGFAGEAPTDQVAPNSTQAQNQAENTSTANEIISDALSDNNLSAANSYEQMQHQNGIISLVVTLAPYLGFLFALLGALIIGIRSSADEKSLAIGVGVATIVGVILFTVLSSGVAGFQYNSMSVTDWEDQYDTNPNQWNGPGNYPPGDVDGDVVTELNNENVSAFNADIPRISTISALQISYGALVVNSLGFGIIAALGAAGLAIIGRRFSE